MSEVTNPHAALWRVAENFRDVCREVLARALVNCPGCQCGRCWPLYAKADIEVLYEVAASRGMLAIFDAAYRRVEKDIEMGYNPEA